MLDIIITVLLILLIILVSGVLFVSFKNGSTLNLREIKRAFEDVGHHQNLDFIQTVSKDSGELKTELIREIGDFKTELSTRVIEENGKIRTELANAIAQNNEKLNKDINEFKQSLNNQIKQDFKQLNVEVDQNLSKINDKVNERLDKSFKQTNETFNNLIERITKIDQAQRKIEELSTNIVDLQVVLTDKKTRGIYGEVQLKHILVSVFGENNNKLYELQKSLSSGVIADSVLYAPEPVGMIAIDSKFPLENYNKMVDGKLSEAERTAARKLFKKDVKTHIDAIATKYIIPNETANQAILFLPAEGVFAEIHAYHNDLVEYGYKHQVTITSPSTLLALTTVIQATVRENEIHKNAKLVQTELNKLSKDFSRFNTRWTNLNKHLDTVSKDVKELNISQEKIQKSFVQISDVQLPEEPKELPEE